MYYSIADLLIEIQFAESELNGSHLIKSMAPFAVSESQQPILFSLTVDDSLRQEANQSQLIKDVDTGNGHTLVWQIKDNPPSSVDGLGVRLCYQFIIKDIFGHDCCLLLTDPEFHHCRCALNGSQTMRQFGLQNALMLCFAFAGIKYDLVLLHASVVRQGDYAYAFTAKSGTGKSTQVANWLRCIPGCDLLNDDNPIVRVVNGETYIYGSPWSGKTPCYRPIKAKLGAITLIKRAPANSVERQQPLEAFTTLLPGVSTMKWDTNIFSTICDILSKIIKTTPVYTLNCLPDLDSARVCYKSLTQQKPHPPTPSPKGDGKKNEVCAIGSEI